MLWQRLPASSPEANADDVAADAPTAREFFEEPGWGDGDAVEVVYQTPEEALKHDLELVAEGKEWSYDEAAAQYLMAEEIGAIAEVVARERPDIFVGSALSETPGGAPTLYIKGPADEFIGDLVAASGVEIVVADNQPYSFEELEARKLTVHHALEEMGFRYVATSVNIAGRGIIPVGVTIEPGLPEQAADIVAALPADVRDDVVLTVHETPNVRDRKAFGGMWVSDNGDELCTSGWSVVSIYTGTTGVTTAGHCPGIDEIDHPGHYIHALGFQNEHRGEWGDVEWHVSAQQEPDDFYAAATLVRDVIDVENQSNLSLNESVCQYGRASNDADCSLDVQDVSQACTNSGVFNDRLVLMDGTTAILGDSGGPWYFGLAAYGSDKGWCNPDFPNQDAWSMADLYQEAIGVTVRQ